MAKIDVLLPVRNGLEFLAESLDSVCNQSFKDWRLIILDHGSTDGSRELAQVYQERDPRIVVHSFPKANGLADLLNMGMDLADCEYLMRHDADDICYPERMAITLAAFSREPECIVIGGQSDVINGAGENIGENCMPVGRNRVAAASLFRNPISHPTAMLRFSESQKLGVRYGVDFLNVLPSEKSLEVKTLAEDYFLFGQLAILGKCTNLSDKLIKYRWHGNNISSTKYDEQLIVALQVSRFLMRCFSQIHNSPWVDPAPFCNHGGILFDVNKSKNFDEKYLQIEKILRAGFGDSDGLTRELTFRGVISSRREWELLWRYNKFRSQVVTETGEWNAIRSWLIRHFPGKARKSVVSDDFF
ncbi:glycosyltransferase family A protein [Actimicrobium sp. CCC2.4]|uniref:glycosyltransferase family 2 protein n=1 Tax=Actimicrobium sp. CCC2.4 TaxID=3048606 RepID=UPI002AC93C82|nr:glycosyltransferase family A protein [Actimicrobium sp. CCC2.4]MEB0136030.1 glycosyltransferase family A protein [Actimicrobium sp. CCC2.4]WPX32693.1 glycosyltransferase family A protein [Actimicrobium sp. CCC2.4]